MFQKTVENRVAQNFKGEYSPPKTAFECPYGKGIMGHEMKYPNSPYVLLQKAGRF
jgi:hypothetical protein